MNPQTAKGLLFGATSITGYALACEFPWLMAVANPSNGNAAGRSWVQVAVEDRTAVAKLVGVVQPQVVIYAHAVCDVAKCEAAPEWAYEINVRSVEHLIQLLLPATRLIYVSSDHVFGGDGSYTEQSMPSPISVYGRTRVAAERLVLSRPGSLVIRPGLAVGPSADGRSGHLDWLRYRYAKGLPITIIDDESRSAVWSHDLAQRIMNLTFSGASGIRHIPATKLISRPQLARHLMHLQNLPPRFRTRRRVDQPVPHLGRVEVRTVHRDLYSTPLTSVAQDQPPFTEVTA